ncbi:alpha-N-arabinofuranosidase [Winogradskya consettensis]|uniref:non-reducing end alpha-L-arabinofuranosidase n=1 Tax=Winogradskya consettensis TaxID=113560 RepID=A0A919SSP6_9ACTN|nr:alpha-N-arabinofuranosidase [Actinoplanes consettensis]GIM76343.1 alpha-N-arabinofuranosidase [Actinoplanes consettensis]
MTDARITLDPAFRLGTIDRRLFGSFVEHMGRSVYTGVFEPGHPDADELGLRTDVLDLAREMGVSVVRYPGGNFVSNYRWEDGVGPRESRPTRLDLAWRSIETNEFGLAEYMAWIRRLGAEPMMAVNLGTRGITEALELLEYCNYPGGTELSDRRISNGDPDPYAVKLWCLGNEMDGPWQMGHRTAHEYGRIAAETGRAMHRLDNEIELVACGSSGRHMPTFGSWETTVLEQCYDQVDYISLHAYYQERDGDVASFLGSAVDMDAFIDEVVSTADAVQARTRSRKRLRLSFDEWNVWNQDRFGGEDSLDWRQAPRLIEDEYNVLDAVVVGSYLISMLGHADRVGIACQAQLANVIGPIRTEPGGPSWRQTIFYPFALTAQLARGEALRVEPDAPLIDTKAYGPVPAIAAAASYDAATGQAALFAVNRDSTNPLTLTVDLRALPGAQLRTHKVLADDDLRATNTQSHPDRVVPRELTGHVDGGTLTVTLPPASWNVLELSTTAE